MKPYDFERLFTVCQNDKQPAGNNPFTMQPGICWFKNTNGFPDIEALEDILAMDGKFDPEDELYSDEGFDLAAEEATIKRDTETIRCGIQDSPFIATIPASSIEIPDGEYITALIEIVFKKDPDSNLYRYIIQSDDTNALFYGVVQQEDALRDIFIASHLYHYSGLIDFNNICGNGSSCRPWSYLVLQADSPEELQEKVAMTRPIRENAQEAWCYCAHVVDSKMHYAFFTLRDGVIPEIVLCGRNTATENSQAVNPFAVIFWNGNVDALTEKIVPAKIYAQ